MILSYKEIQRELKQFGEIPLSPKGLDMPSDVMRKSFFV